MFVYDKKLQYPVKIAAVNPRLAAIIISQYGGPDGELGASLRYLSQRYAMPFDELKGLLTDIGTEWSKWGTTEAPQMQARQKILCKRFSTKSRISRRKYAFSGLFPLSTVFPGGL